MARGTDIPSSTGAVGPPSAVSGVGRAVRARSRRRLPPYAAAVGPKAPRGRNAPVVRTACDAGRGGRRHHDRRQARCPELVSPAFDACGVDEFTAPPYAAVRQAILDAGGAEYGVQDPQEYLIRVRDAAPDDTVRAMVTELAVEAIMRRAVDEVYAGEVLVRVRRRAVERRVREVNGKLARLSNHADQAELSAVQNELWVLQQYDQALREHGAAAL